MNEEPCSLLSKDDSRTVLDGRALIGHGRVLRRRKAFGQTEGRIEAVAEEIPLK